MPASRGLVALVALAVLVWGVAFAGGATVAVLTASVGVTTAFETPNELSQIDEPAGDEFAAVAVENGTAGTNETAPTANATGPGENVSAPTDGNVSAPTDGNASSPPDDGNVSAPIDGNASSPPEDGNASAPIDDNVSAPAEGNVSVPEDGNASSPPETSPATDGNTSAPDDGNASSSSETGPEPSETGEPPVNESSDGGNATDVSAAANAVDADRQSASGPSNAR